MTVVCGGGDCYHKHKFHGVSFSRRPTFVTPFDRKSWNLYTPPVFSAPVGGPCRNFAKVFSIGKLERLPLGYYMLKKVWWYVKPFQYNTRVWQTERRTELLYQYHSPALLCCMLMHIIIIIMWLVLRWTLPFLRACSMLEDMLIEIT